MSVNLCPVIDVFVIAPARARVGSAVQLRAAATDPNSDPISITWGASAGTIADRSSLRTTYRCTAPGTQVLTVAVSDGHCSESEEAPVICDP